MSHMFAALGPFGDAFDFIFHQRESQAGTVQVGGPGEIWELTWMHLKLSLAATAIATVVALPIGLWLGHIGRYQFLATSTSNIGRAVPALGLIVFFIAFLGVGFVNVCAALAITFWPVADEPVNEIFRMSACLVMASPRSLASVMTFSTPFGRMSLTSSAKRSVASGVVGAGFTTRVLPASSAEGSLKLRISSG